MTNEQSGLTTALETITSYKNTRWGLDGQVIVIDDNGEFGEDEELRIQAMFAFCRVIDPGDMMFVNVCDTIKQGTFEIAVTENEDGTEDIALEEVASGSEMFVTWLAENFAEGTADLVRQTLGPQVTDAVGGEERFGVVVDVAGEIAANFESRHLDDLPGTEATIRESLQWILVGKACAQAMGRPDIEESMDYLLGSFFFGNPVFGMSRDHQLIVVTE